MTTYDDEQEISFWNNPISILKIVLVIVSITLFITTVVIPVMKDPKQTIEHIQNYNDNKINEIQWVRHTNNAVSYSTDCNELKMLQLDLISKGAVTDSWFPDMNDKSLKIAEKRYEILCGN